MDDWVGTRIAGGNQLDTLTVTVAAAYGHTFENNKRTLNYLQITKTDDNNYSLQFWRDSGLASVNFGTWDETTLLRELQSSNPSVTSTEGTLTAGTARAISTNIDSGSFDHFIFAWDREEPVADVILYAVGIAVLE
jgi:hypothetical protein